MSPEFLLLVANVIKVDLTPDPYIILVFPLTFVVYKVQ